MPEVILNGPHGRIECRYHSGQSPDSPIALILHPEPNKGGSMNNKVSYGMYHEFRNRGFSVWKDLLIASFISVCHVISFSWVKAVVVIKKIIIILNIFFIFFIFI